MKRAFAVLLLVLLVTVAWGQKKPKNAIPGLILHARYVYVTAFTGDQFNPRIMQDDRLAINDVIDALKKWGRYAITYDEQNADLLMVVRRGKIAAAKIGGDVSVGTPGVGVGNYGGVEAGSPDDTLMVMNGHGKHALDTAALWRRSAHNGLRGPDPALVEAFKKDVEQAAAKQP